MDWDERIGRRLSLWDLSILLTAVEAGSISKAAETVRLSKAAISKTIAQLEREVGVQLITRSSRGIVPTESGDALLARSRAALGELSNAVDAMHTLSEMKVGELRIAANEVALSGLVGTVINRLYAQYPGIVFNIVPAYTHAAQLHELEQGNVELVVGQLPQSAIGHNLEALELFQDQLAVVAGAHNAWTQRSPIELTELLNEPWVFSPLNSVSGRSMEQAFLAEGLPLPRIMVVASSMQLLRRLVMDNAFLTLFPNSVARSARGIRILPVKINAYWQPVGILTMKYRTLSPLAKLFIECAQSIARGDDN
jgi:DNA-binding transcriptional LysR family regulator